MVISTCVSPMWRNTGKLIVQVDWIVKMADLSMFRGFIPSVPRVIASDPELLSVSGNCTWTPLNDADLLWGSSMSSTGLSMNS